MSLHDALPIFAAAGLLLVAGIGWLDDHRPLTPWSRLAVHAVASCLLGIVAIGAGGQFASALFAFVLAMVLVNIWNFMDGIDGIAALQALVVAGGCALLAGDPASRWMRSEEHTSELQSLMRISYAVFCLKKKKQKY